jgi:hypothetical protein
MTLYKWRLAVALSLVTMATLYVLIGSKLIGRWFSQASPPVAGVPEASVYLVVNKNSGRCLGIEAGAKTAGAKVVQGSQSTEPQAHEYWMLREAGSARKFVSRHSRYSLEICDGITTKGALACQGPDRDNAPNQAWEFERVGDGFLLRAVHSRLVLGIGQGSRVAGAAAIQWDRVEGANDQVWLLIPMTDTESR